MNVFLVEQTSRKRTPSVTKQEVLFKEVKGGDMFSREQSTIR